MAGSAVIGALRVNLGIDTAQFTEGLKGVRASLDKVGRNLQQAGAKLSTYVTAPITAAGALVTAAVTTMAKDIEELQKSAQISNAGFEEFQKLAFAAKSVGIEGGKLADIFKDVNDRVGDFVATGGGPMADFFKNIAPKVGITAEAFRELSGPQALQLYYDSLVKAGASQQDMTFYLEAMASDATALIPLLRDGGKAFQELGEGAAVLSEQDAAGLKAYNDSMRALGEAIKSATIAIANSGLLDWITAVVQKVTEWVQALSKTNPEIVKWGAVVAGLAAALGPAVAALGLFLTGIAAISAPALAVVAGIAALTTALIAFAPQINAAQAAIEAFLTGAWNMFVSGWDAVAGKVNAAQTAIENFASQIVSYFANIPAQMLEIGGQIIDGLWNGIKAKWESVKAGVAGIGSSIANSVKSTLGIQSPSKVFHEIGTNIMQGLSNGMQSMAGSVAGGAGTIADDLQNAFSGIGSSIGEAVKGTREWSDVLKDVLGQIAKIALSKVNFGGGFGGFLSGIFGGLFGFANGGSFKVGGAGGIDSQLVAFRASPNETVSVTKPGQERGGGVADVRVYVDQDGNWQAAVERIAEGPAARAAETVANSVPTLVDARTDERQYRRLRPRSAF